ncbi:MAG TPA: 4Fe-4S binding protein [Candidatus Aquicultor sp.]|jgi:MauM/NapG family ferredoxin protein
MRFKVSNYRRVIQAFFFLLFIVLLGITAKQTNLLFPTQLFLASDPLVAIAAALAGLPVVGIALYSLITVAITLLFGRVFCGYVCPMGTLLDLFSPLAKVVGFKQKRFRILKVVPLITLFLVLAFSLFKSSILMVFDPIVLLTRTFTVAVFPGVSVVISKTMSPLFNTSLSKFADSVTTSLNGMVVYSDPRTFIATSWIVLLFILVVGLNILGKRFWCRYLCPLGGLLGLLGKIPLFRRRVEATACTSCLSCTKVCDMDAVTKKGLATDAGNCMLCMKCRKKCPQHAISWGLKPELSTEIPSRRTALLAIGGSVAAAYLASLGVKARVLPQNALLVRPPGVRAEDEFLNKCVRCGECLKACPTNVLQPALVQYGLESLWTPHLDFTVAGCDYSCNACSRVCPTGAIESITLKEKQKLVIGKAVIDRKRCYPWIAGHGCQICYNMCPLPEKAIYMKDTNKYDASGMMIVLPYVIEDRCIGCGICENECPVKCTQKGITVFRPGRPKDKNSMKSSDLKGLAGSTDATGTASPVTTSTATGKSQSAGNAQKKTPQKKSPKK